MSDPRPRLTMATAKVGTKVVCVNGSVTDRHPETGGTYTVWTVLRDMVRIDKARGDWSMTRFVLADPPTSALPAMTPELVAALREWHATLGPRLEYQGGYDTECIRLQEAIAACPGLLAPPPATTDATATLPDGWWA